MSLLCVDCEVAPRDGNSPRCPRCRKERRQVSKLRYKAKKKGLLGSAPMIWEECLLFIASLVVRDCPGVCEDCWVCSVKEMCPLASMKPVPPRLLQSVVVEV